MNEFEKRMNALRRQYSAERARISKDAYRRIWHLNTAIGQVNTIEAREALRAEKERAYEAMRTSHKYNRLCYSQQLEMIEDEYRIHLDNNPSKNQLRRAMSLLSLHAQSIGEKSFSIAFGDNRHGEVSFD